MAYLVYLVISEDRTIRDIEGGIFWHLINQPLRMPHSNTKKQIQSFIALFSYAVAQW